MTKLWHCAVCNGEWEQPDHVVSFWHRCSQRFTGGEDYAPRRFRVGEDRGVVWYALLEQVGEEQTWRQ